MQVSDAVRLRHMLDAAREAVAFATGRSRDDLLRDRVLTLALLKCIEIVRKVTLRLTLHVRHGRRMRLGVASETWWT